MTSRTRDVSSNDDDGDDVSTDISGSSVRRRHNRDEDSDVPRFFYGRAADSVATGNDRRQQTDDVITSRVSRDTSNVGTLLAEIFSTMW